MRFDWRHLAGPALTVTLAVLAVALHGGTAAFLMLSPLLVLSVAGAAAIGGLAPGMVSAAIAIATAVAELPDDAARSAHIAALSGACVAAAAIIGLLQRRLLDAESWGRRRQSVAERLSGALDRIDIGLVLLDNDTRAEFINRAFRDYFRLPDAKADSKPPFIALMYHDRDVGASDLDSETVAPTIAARTEMIRSGDATPMHMTLSDGRVLRMSCTSLPDGGRMLSYAPVNDAIREGDDPARRSHYLSLRRDQNRPFRILPPAAE